MVTAIHDLEAQVRAGVEDPQPPASGSPFAPLLDWLRAGQDRRDDEPAGARPRTVGPRPGVVTPGWLLRPLDSTGPEAEPDVGTPGWLDRHRLY